MIRHRISMSNIDLSKRVLWASLTAALLLGSSACEKNLYKDETGVFHGTGSKVYAYDSGTPKRVDRYVAGRLTCSTWYKPNGEVVAETLWGKEGKGLDYYLNENGMVITKAEVTGGMWHGRSWRYDEQGNVTDIRTYAEGVLMEGGEVAEETEKEAEKGKGAGKETVSKRNGVGKETVSDTGTGIENRDNLLESRKKKGMSTFD